MGEGPYGALLDVLGRARDLGFLGPGAIEPHVERALDALALIRPEVRRALDLGSGGGLPGLPLLLARPRIHWVLLDGSETRGRFLRAAVEDLDVGDRVEVIASRAEVAGRAPAVTAECAAPFLVVGARLVVAEPPGGSPGRWPPGPLGDLGLRPEQTVSQPSAFQVLRQERLCPDRYPRRTGVPAKRPLF